MEVVNLIDGEVLALCADLTQPADFEAFIDDTIEQFGRLDLLIGVARR